MSNSVRYYVWVAIALVCIAGVLALRFAPSVLRMGRRRGSSPSRLRRPKPAGDRQQRNIAPLATVTVSSEDTEPRTNRRGRGGGRPDASEWSSAGEGAGAWITLTWDRPAVVTEIDLYDRPSPVDNVLSGTLSFDDGTVIVVHALPADGAPERVIFAPKTIHTVTFRIDQAQGRNAGLGEIMVVGTLN